MTERERERERERESELDSRGFEAQIQRRPQGYAWTCDLKWGTSRTLSGCQHRQTTKDQMPLLCPMPQHSCLPAMAKTFWRENAIPEKAEENLNWSEFCFFHLAEWTLEAEIKLSYWIIMKATYFAYPHLWSELTASYKPRKSFKMKYWSLKI